MKLRAILLLSRPVNVLIGMASIGVAAAITGTVSPLKNVLLASLSGGLITAAANSINDYYDLEIDRVNKPYRPLPAGMIRPGLVPGIALIEFTAGILAGAFINVTAFSIALIFSLLLYFYSAYLKRVPLWGNILVSLASAMAFIYGGVAVNRVPRTIIPAAFAFFFHLGREIIKDVQDMEGDARVNARTFPLVYGKTRALTVASVNFLLLMILIFIPFLKEWYGEKYFLTCLFGVYPVLIFSMVGIWKNQSFRNLGFISNLLKADMLVGLLAIYLG